MRTHIGALGQGTHAPVALWVTPPPRMVKSLDSGLSVTHPILRLLSNWAWDLPKPEQWLQ
jgi:hypothetical protein